MVRTPALHHVFDTMLVHSVSVDVCSDGSGVLARYAPVAGRRRLAECAARCHLFSSRSMTKPVASEPKLCQCQQELPLHSAAPAHRPAQCWHTKTPAVTPPEVESP